MQDSFAKNFADRSQFMSFLDEIEERADWMVCPTDSLYLTAAEMNSAACRKMKQAEDGEQLLNDTGLNTGLFIKADGMDYPLGTTAMKTLQNRARIYGNALQDMDRPTFAGVLNDCLQVTSGQALLRLQEGKIRAVHGGDPKDYAVLPMPEIFEAANMYLEESYGKVIFSEGYFSHELVTAAWQLQEPEYPSTGKLRRLCRVGLMQSHKKRSKKRFTVWKPDLPSLKSWTRSIAVCRSFCLFLIFTGRSSWNGA